jgi:hypothetical protein
MAQENASVAIYDVHTTAQEAVRRLHKSGFDMRKVSVAGRDGHSGNEIVGYYHDAGGMRYWGKMGSFWGTLWGLLDGWAFLSIPGIGPVLVAGPLAGWIVAALQNAAIFGGLTALGAGLYSIGISKDDVVGYETALRCGKYLVLVHGAADEVGRAKETLRSARGTTFSRFVPPDDDAKFSRTRLG